MSELSNVISALSGVIIGGYLNNFLAEDYKRFRNSQAIAAALAGELKGLKETVDRSADTFNYILKEISQYECPENKLMGEIDQDWNKGDKVESRFLMPKEMNPVYASHVEKIGLLGPDLAQGVAYVYQLIVAFQTGASIFTSDHYKNISIISCKITVDNCLRNIHQANEHGLILIPELIRYSKEPYWKICQFTKARLYWIACASLIIIGTLGAIFAAKYHPASTEMPILYRLEISLSS